MSFYESKGIMEKLLTGDIAKETLQIAEEEYQSGMMQEEEEIRYPAEYSRDIPIGEDIKWMCGDCGATDWTPNKRRCKYCKEV